MAFLKDTEREQLRQLVKACLLEISKLKIQLKKCQKESSQKTSENLLIEELKLESQNKLDEKDQILKNKDDKINSLNVFLQKQEKQINELRKVKLHFDAITAKPKTDLTSFQSQIYQLLPETEDTIEKLYNYITSIGFSELSNENFEYLLRNLERKNYCQSRSHNNQIYWKKLIK
jgi:chromosome segregation ATPase